MEISCWFDHGTFGFYAGAGTGEGLKDFSMCVQWRKAPRWVRFGTRKREWTFGGKGKGPQ
jgi:hypothetical protein